MMFFTAGRVGSTYKRHLHFFVMHIGVKMYEIKVGRDGIARFKYAGVVEGTVTLDRYIRRKKEKLAEECAAARGGTYVKVLRHNMQAPPLYALSAALQS